MRKERSVIEQVDSEADLVTAHCHKEQQRTAYPGPTSATMAASNGSQRPNEPSSSSSSSSSSPGVVMMNGQLDFARSLADSSTPRLTGGLSATRPAPAPAPPPPPAPVADSPTAPLASSSKNPTTPPPPQQQQEDPLAILLTTLSADDGESILSIAVEEARDDARDQLGHRFGHAPTSTSSGAGTGKRQAGRVYGGSQGGNIHVRVTGEEGFAWLAADSASLPGVGSRNVIAPVSLDRPRRRRTRFATRSRTRLASQRIRSVSHFLLHKHLGRCVLKLPERRRHDPSVAHADALARLPDPSTARQHRRHPLARVDPVQHARAGRSGSEQAQQPPRHCSSAHPEPETRGETLCWMSGHEYTGAPSWCFGSLQVL